MSTAHRRRRLLVVDDELELLSAMCESLQEADSEVIVEMAGSNTLLQTIVDEDKRGRLISFYTLASQGMAPLGSLLTGTLGSWLKLTLTFLVNGLLCLTGAALFAVCLPRLRVLMWPVSLHREIPPPLTTDITAVSELHTTMKE